MTDKPHTVIVHGTRVTMAGLAFAIFLLGITFGYIIGKVLS